MYRCPPCGYQTNRKSNLERHRASRKHQRNVSVNKFGNKNNNSIVSYQKQTQEFQVCQPVISQNNITDQMVDKSNYVNNDNNNNNHANNSLYQQHEYTSEQIHTTTSSTPNQKEKLNQNFICEICLRQFSRLYHLQRHQKKIKKCQPPAVSKTETTTVKETHNIQFYLPDWLSVDEFIQNLQTSHQLTAGETRGLLDSFEQNIVSYRSCLSRTLTENCYRQLVDKKAGETSLEVEEKLGRDHVLGLLTQPDLDPDKKIKQIISISNRQVFDHHKQLIELQIEHQQEVVQYLCDTGKMVLTGDQNVPQICDSGDTITISQDEFNDLEKQPIPDQLTYLELDSLDSIVPVKDIKRKNASFRKKKGDRIGRKDNKGDVITGRQGGIEGNIGGIVIPKPKFIQNDSYQTILDCGTSYLVNRRKQVFKLEKPHPYIGRYRHDDDCPCEGEGARRGSWSGRCWFYIQYDGENGNNNSSGDVMVV